jgi:hypothetical protein
MAFAACDRREWVVCLNGLNSARELDPEGDNTKEVGAARTQAEEEIRKELAPSPTAIPVPKDQKDSVTPPPPPVTPTGMTKPTKPVYNGKAKPTGKSDLGTPLGGDDGLGSKGGVQKKVWDQRNGP